MYGNGKPILINEYLEGISNINTDYSVLDICYLYCIDEYLGSHTINEVIEKHFEGESEIWKEHNCEVSLIEDGYSYLKNLCMEWFHKGLNDLLIDISPENAEHFKEFSKNRYTFSKNAVRSFIEKLETCIDDGEPQFYLMKSNPAFFYELLWDDILIVTRNKKFIIHFGMSD